MARTATSQDDYILIEDENVELDAGDGDDEVIVTRSGAVVSGGAGDDWLSSSIYVYDPDPSDGDQDWPPATTELRGDDGNDWLHASLRADVYYGPSLTAKLYGGDGDDLLWIDLVASSAFLNSFADGGDGNDRIRVTTMSDSNYGGASGPINIDGGAGDDDITVFVHAIGSQVGSEGQVATVHGGDGADRIESSLTFSDWTTGGSDNYLYGGAGDDEIIGTADGSSDFGDSSNRARGGSGDDVMTLTALGGSGAINTVKNTVFGDSGDDVVAVLGKTERTEDSYTTGENWVSGGAGDDSLTVRLELMGDEIVAENDVRGGSGNDRLSVVLNVSEGDYRSGWVSSGVNLLRGDDGDDRLYAQVDLGDAERGSAHSELSGGRGDDRMSVRGGEGNILEGNRGDDTLYGSDNSDRLNGGMGADRLTGRGGDDAFVFTSAPGGSLRERDLITDFGFGGARGDDVIDLSAIDANAFRSGNQSFIFGSREGTGRVWVEDNPDTIGNLVFADTGRKLLVIEVADGSAVSASDWTGLDFVL